MEYVGKMTEVDAGIGKIVLYIQYKNPKIKEIASTTQINSEKWVKWVKLFSRALPTLNNFENHTHMKGNGM